MSDSLDNLIALLVVADALRIEMLEDGDPAIGLGPEGIITYMLLRRIVAASPERLEAADALADKFAPPKSSRPINPN
jgi:hypothetical protein